MKSRQLLTILCLFFASEAGASPLIESLRQVKPTADMTFASLYMTDGFKVGNGPVLQPSINLDFGESGLSALIWASIQTEAQSRQFDELDFFLRGTKDLFAGARHEIRLNGFASYWAYPGSGQGMDEFGAPVSRPTRKGYKLNAGFSMPKLLPLAGSQLILGYNFYYWLYWQNDQRDLFQGGGRHELSAYYDHSLPRFIPGAEAQYVGATVTANQHTGAFNVQPGFSHVTAQLAVSVHALSLIFTASANRQWSFQSSVDPEDELWSTFSVTRRF